MNNKKKNVEMKFRAYIFIGLIILIIWSILIFSCFKIRGGVELKGNFPIKHHHEKQVMDIEQIVRGIEAHSSVPIVYWQQNKKYTPRNSSICAKLPSIYGLKFKNIYWQTLETKNGTIEMFGAYLDIRKSSPIGPSIRIMAMIDRIQPKVETFCQIWFDKVKSPVFVKTLEYKYIWYDKWGGNYDKHLQPYLISCVLPENFNTKIPAAVSLVEKQCDNATNILRVNYNISPDNEKKPFAVCVKGLDYLYDDITERLVEWIELLGILGAEKIYFYELQVHSNISKALKYYEDEGKIQVTPQTLTGNLPNIPGFQNMYLSTHETDKRQNEIIPYNDCFYKNMYKYEYIALLDIDEVIMPKNDDMTWHDLMDHVIPDSIKNNKNKVFSSYCFRNVYFLDEFEHAHGWVKDIPENMHMLQHINRFKNHSNAGMYTKCFHNTELILGLHNHFPFSCIGRSCNAFTVDVNNSQLNHYRSTCVAELSKACEEFKKYKIEDKTIWKYKDELILRTMKVLEKLGY